jgi:hypothetical protein
MEYGLDTKQFRHAVVRPVLQRLELWRPAAENLVVGTALHESHLKYVKQIGGPAFGLFQMEGPTHADLYRSFLNAHQDLKRKIVQLATFFSAEFPDPSEMIFNLAYATAMCRVHYLRVKEGLPPADRADLLAAYWKTYYNTRLGKGTVAQALPHFELAVKEGAQ